eukprot:COSAG06_NODE_824_length_12073_cov_102.305161_13_plen_108_part_00
MYNRYVRDKIDVLRERGAWHADNDSKDVDGGDGRGQAAAEWNSPPTSHCCLGLNIPKSAWTTALMPVGVLSIITPNCVCNSLCYLILSHRLNVAHTRGAGAGAGRRP